MNIPKLSHQNEPNFGIKYLNKPQWDKKVLRTFEKSNLLESIDKKYSFASIKYDKFYEFESDTHTLAVVLKLTKEKLFRWTLSSHNKDVPKEHLINFINTTSLEEIESKSTETFEPLFKVTVTPIKQSFFERIKKLFEE